MSRTAETERSVGSHARGVCESHHKFHESLLLCMCEEEKLKNEHETKEIGVTIKTIVFRMNDNEGH